MISAMIGGRGMVFQEHMAKRMTVDGSSRKGSAFLIGISID